MRVPSDELFRPTAVPDQPSAESDPVVELVPTSSIEPSVELASPVEIVEAPARAASGRVKHDEKMTVYVTSDELFEIEDARLRLRRHHGLAVDRGRLVRAAVAMALADLDEQGADSGLLRRLSRE